MQHLLQPRRTAMMIAAHVVWGAAMGLSVRALEKLFSPPAARPQTRPQTRPRASV